MGFDIYKESYAGGIKEITLGKAGKGVTVGGQTSYPFYKFEGDMPHKPKVAMEVWDMAPEDWAEAAVAPFKDVISDPAAWAKKCVELGADMIVLQLKSTDPNAQNAGGDAAAATVKKVLAAVDVPLIVWGVANVKKDEEVLGKIAEECQGAKLVLGPVEDKNHKGIGAKAMAYGHTLISSSPIDVNLAKQVNILLENLGVSMDQIIIDPTTGGLGYGLEYSYSVMERIRMAAMAQGDDKLQLPLINNLGNEVWKCKEAKMKVEEDPTIGDPEKRGILMEAVGAITYLMAGSDILIMRHPEAVRMVKAYIGLLADGGSAKGLSGIGKKMADVDLKLEAHSPAPDLTIAEDKKAAKPAAAAKAAPAAAAAPKAEAKPAPAAADTEADKAKQQAAREAEEQARQKAEVDARAKAEADAKAKKEADAKAQKDAAEKAKKDAADKDKAAADAREAEEARIREARAKERDARGAHGGAKAAKVSKTASTTQKSPLDKMIDQLDKIHRRA